ncbi:pyridoxamine 5'-phosphate oxidase [Thalassotalea sp. ND16A]|uniref:pyridoxamine 5'-phosphate oxidase n=1 Tax=Thalassotalea sp. ND16A TaxID=1535422 RepID=UPI00051A3A2C|nr:pyridoxamine 5'-phosphate oxidase [Thalassotalea sp. ND16A]KGJ90243.1 Pyridoxal 5'-phosphate synthase [Thalassotalea sp. ND16A]
MTLLEKFRCLFTFGQGVALPLPVIPESKSPFELFQAWFDDANKSGILLAEAMSVSSCSADGQPSSRMVLLKSFDDTGFVFYTNYGSRKSQELQENDKVALLFHWGVLQRQIRIEGVVKRTSQAQSEQYFHSRDRGSQIGAWASRQSEKLSHSDELKDREQQYKTEFADKQVPLPEFWGGYRVEPSYIEFWQGRASRLHDRICFEKQDEGWDVFHLHP